MELVLGIVTIYHPINLGDYTYNYTSYLCEVQHGLNADALLAQRIEQQPSKLWVEGSNPSGGTDGH